MELAILMVIVFVVVDGDLKNAINLSMVKVATQTPFALAHYAGRNAVNHLFQDAPVMDHAILMVIVFVILVGLV